MLDPEHRIVITGIGLTAPNGDDLPSYRAALLEKRSGVQPYEIRYVGPTLAGICHFNALVLPAGGPGAPHGAMT